MATEIIHWCDVHLHTDERVPVVAAHNLMVDGEGLVIELCESCEAGSWKELRAYLAAFAVRAKDAGKPLTAAPVKVPSSSPSKPTPTGPVDCPWCRENVGSKYQEIRHARVAHGLDFPTEGYGLGCPLCEWGADPERGTPQAVATHATQAHQTHSLRELFTLAESAGDPLGVVAARRAWVAARERAREVVAE